MNITCITVRDLKDDIFKTADKCKSSSTNTKVREQLPTIESKSDN